MYRAKAEHSQATKENASVRGEDEDNSSHLFTSSEEEDSLKNGSPGRSSKPPDGLVFHSKGRGHEQMGIKYEEEVPANGMIHHP